MPKVSVIIPIYNAETYLRQCLDSVFNQTLQDFEVICVNDKSQDSSLDILKEYAAKDSRLKIINFEENKGPGATRNAALEIAQGEYIMFLDADDWLELSAFEELYNQITQYDNDIVFFNHSKYKNETGEKEEDLKHKIILESFGDSKCLNVDNCNLYYYRYSWDKIYKRSFLIDNNCKFAEVISGEAKYFTVKTLLYAKSISVLNKSFYNYRVYVQQNESRQGEMLRRAHNFVENIKSKRMLYELIKQGKYNSFAKLVLIDVIKGLLTICISYSQKYDIDKSKIYSLTRQAILEINESYDVEDLKKEIKCVSPYSSLNDAKIAKIHKTKLEDGVIVAKLDKEIYQQFENFLKYKNWFEYNLFANILKKLGMSIFSIKNTQQHGVKRKTISFLGLKLKFKEDKNGKKREQLSGRV